MTFINSGHTVLSVTEIRRILLEIDNCQGEVVVPYDDGTEDRGPCTIQCMCDECVNKFAGLLEWAEDMEAEQGEQLQLDLKA